MPAISRSLEKLMVFGAIALTPCLGFGQQIFTYSATDIQAQSVSAPAPLSFQVRTVFVVLGNSAAIPHLTGATKDMTVRLKPPAGWSRLVRATIGGKLVDTFIKGSNIDGEMIGSVKLPPESNPGDVHILWQLQDGSLSETAPIAN